MKASARDKRTGDPAAIKTILVPIDFSAPSLKAMQYACRLAKRCRAKLHLVQVNELVAGNPLLTLISTSPAHFTQTLQRRLESLGRKCVPPVAPANCHLRKGKPFEQICRTARQLDADLIVIATHGYSGLKHILVGSTAERVVRHAPCPVLVVRVRERAGARPGVARVLVPTDFSEHSRDALNYAIGFAKRVDAKLTLLNTIYPQYFTTNVDYLAADFGELYDETRRAASSEMKALVSATRFRGVPFKTRIEEGHPGDVIVDFAKTSKADLIITSTHGRTGLRQVLLGSVAEQVVRYANCPVLVVPRVVR